jgi:molybdopterin-guanine dinucleotide biosynthesis protein A
VFLLESRVEAFILAGGKSRRFGSNKALASFGHHTMVEAVANILLRVFPRVTVVAKTSHQVDGIDFPVILDRFEYPGNLAGIATALNNSTEEHIFIVSCDHPLIDEKVVKRILVHTGDEDVLIPQIDGRHQPTHALYRTSARSKLPSSPSSALPDFLYSLNKRYLFEEDFADIEHFGRSFFNINTREDYERAISISGMSFRDDKRKYQ